MSSNLPRGLAVLHLLSKETDGLPLHTIAERLDVPRSTAHRLLAELVSCGYVRQVGELTPYRLTFKMAKLGLGYLSASGINELIQPVIERLAQRSGELVRMSLVEGDRLVWVARAHGARRGGLHFDASSDPGEEVRLFCSSEGHAWLSCLTDEKALHIATRQGFGDPGEFGPNAPMGIEDFLRYLRQARQRGYAVAHETHEVGTASIAAAVRHADDQRVIGTVSIAGPEVRLRPERVQELASLLLAAAQELSAGSGGLRASLW